MSRFEASTLMDAGEVGVALAGGVADDRREVHDRVAALQQRPHGVQVADVGLHQLEAGVVDQVAHALVAVGHAAPVDADDVGPFVGEQATGQRPAHVAGGAGHEDRPRGCIRAHAIASCSSRTRATRSTSTSVMAGKRGTVTSRREYSSVNGSGSWGAYTVNRWTGG